VQSRGEDLELWSRLWPVREGTPAPFCAHAFLKVITWDSLLSRNRSEALSWSRNLGRGLLRSPRSCWRAEKIVQGLKGAHTYASCVSFVCLD
jgi:hypothetical protein